MISVKVHLFRIHIHAFIRAAASRNVAHPSAALSEHLYTQSSQPTTVMTSDLLMVSSATVRLLHATTPLQPFHHSMSR